MRIGIPSEETGRDDSRADDAPRLTKAGKPDARYRRAETRADESRKLADRGLSDERDEMTDDDRLALAVSQQLETIMPNLPPIHGYSLCWVSPTHPSDTPTNRMALGWQFVTKDDMPGLMQFCNKSGEYEGVVSCREMILMKIRNGLREKFLKHFHHDAPNEADGRIQEQALQMSDGRGRQIGFIEGEGLQREKPRNADFSHLMG